MLVVNVAAIVAGALIVGGLVRGLFPQTQASYGAVVISALAGGLIMFAACLNLALPRLFSLSVGGHTVFIFWILVGNLWSALIGSFVAGRKADKGSGVR